MFREKVEKGVKAYVGNHFTTSKYLYGRYKVNND
jgi:hypothetical protein